MTVFIILCLNTALIRAPNLLSTAYLDTPSNLYTLIIQTDQRQNKRSLIGFYVPATYYHLSARTPSVSMPYHLRGLRINCLIGCVVYADAPSTWV